MSARHLVLLATGKGKAEAVHQLVEGPVSAMWPATILQHHPHVTVLVDDAAASRLQLADYYRETYAVEAGLAGSLTRVTLPTRRRADHAVDPGRCRTAHVHSTP